MRRTLLIGICLAAALLVRAAVAVPEMEGARLIVLANNLQNYYYNYDESSRPNYHTETGFIQKTQKIVNMMIASNADIFAFCELEAKPIILEYLVNTLNEQLGAEEYAFVADGINITTDSYDNAIKAGFAYRIATVEPYGSNYSATNITYYRNVMRIQAWTEKSTGERFTLSMNHFKAMSDDASKAKRVDNATWLLAGLSSYKVQDPDILIMGDFNAQMDEEAISMIVKGGFAEQLLRFDPDSYSYLYYGAHELIDHAFANSTMAEQIVGAAVWHTNTPVTNYLRYSDHDAVMVGLRLGPQSTEDVENVETTASYEKILRHGQLIIIRSGVEYTVTGQRVR